MGEGEKCVRPSSALEGEGERGINATKKKKIFVLRKKRRKRKRKRKKSVVEFVVVGEWVQREE